jgi:hypothetical protein
VKAAAIVLATLAMLSSWHVTFLLAGQPVAVPLPVLALAAELAVCALLGWLIVRAAAFRSHPYPRRTA